MSPFKALEGWQTSEILACLSICPEIFNQALKGLCTNFLERELLQAWLTPRAWTGYTRENVFPPENRKGEILMENASIWLRSCPSRFENEMIQPFSVINHHLFSSSLPSPAPSPLLCYLSLPFATEFPLVTLQKWHFCSTRQGKWFEGAFALLFLERL